MRDRLLAETNFKLVEETNARDRVVDSMEVIMLQRFDVNETLRVFDWLRREKSVLCFDDILAQSHGTALG